MSGLGLSRIMALAIAAAAGGSYFPVMTNGAPRLARPATRNLTTTTQGSSYTYGYMTGPGWTAAHVKRMAKKRRNQQRHRAAMKGK